MSQNTFEVGLSTMPLSERMKPARQRRNTWNIDLRMSARRSVVYEERYLEYGEEDVLDGHAHHDWVDGSEVTQRVRVYICPRRPVGPGTLTL